MRRLIRLAILTLVLTLVLLAASVLVPPGGSLAAQEEPEEAPSTFVPTEELPADAAVSFPTDI